MKKGLLLITFTCIAAISFAGHISAGELFYVYDGPGAAANTSRYRITMKLFRDCASTGQALNGETVTIGIYNNPALQRFTTLALAPQWTGVVPRIQNTNGANPCLSPFVSVCYEVGIFSGTIELPNTADGYTLSWVRFTRSTLENVIDGPGSFVGATFTTKIPGTNQLPAGVNNCAQFVTKDTSTICRSNSFMIDFSAIDSDPDDSLVYYFSAAYDGTPDPANPTVPNPQPAAMLTLPTLNYEAGYSGTSPLGAAVTINPQTGIISGVAPGTPGYYAICVVVEEWRNGQRINQHRKDFILKIGDCSSTDADLGPDKITCDGYTYQFTNNGNSSTISSYQWNFGNPASGASNVSTAAQPSHTFTDTGRYQVKLVVSNAAGCKDSSTVQVSVYPIFNTEFSWTGNCFQSPFQFQDGTTSTHGVIDSWLWDFDTAVPGNDTAHTKNPSFLYSTSGNRSVRLITTNSKGCADTIVKTVTVRDNPLLTLPFKDTLICSIDNLPLIAQGTGNFSWVAEPADPTLTTPNISNPIVSPNDTTRYIVTLNDNGCIKKDTINVNVLTFITVDLGLDTGICRTDTIPMKTQSHALSYQWWPATGLSSTTAKYPDAFPLTTTTYYVQANLGLCPATDSITIQVAPYPIADAGNPETICYGEKVMLNANYVGTGFAWSPVNTLQNPNSLTPYAGPMQTTAYVFTAMSTGICPKPSHDTVVVTVMPPVKAFAGNDTVITALQPLQLQATGGASYSWSPPFGLSATNIANPVAMLPHSIDEITYRVRVSDTAGCFAYDEMKVLVYKTGPQIFIPTAFTPNGDGRNEIAMPVLVGMERLDYFRVYNRWGQMVYSTSQVGKGWNGELAGKPQPSGTYVYTAQAVDFTGKTVFKKGTLVLIR